MHKSDAHNMWKFVLGLLNTIVKSQAICGNCRQIQPCILNWSSRRDNCCDTSTLSESQT